MTEHPLDLLESYALRLLLPESETEVADHLQACDGCRQRVRDIEQTLGLLAYATPPRELPAGSEDRLLARIEALRLEERAARHASIGQPSVSASPVSAPQPRRLVPRQLRRASWPSRAVYALGAAAAVLLLAIGMLGANLSATHATNDRLTAQVRAQQTALALIADPNVIVRALKPTERVADGAQGKMAMNPQTNQGVLVVSHLPTLSRGKTYEFWLVHETPTSNGTTREDVTPVDTFTVDANGSAVVSFTSRASFDSVRNAGISIEHSGGAAHPDSPMIMLLA